MKRKIGLVFAVSIVAILAIGVTYGLWFQTLYVVGTVYTGTLDAAWSIHAVWDTEPEVKDVSSLTIVPGQDDYTLIATVNNGYPCIWYYALLDLTNTGTIPWIVYEATLTSDAFPGTVEFVPWDDEFLLFFPDLMHPEFDDKMPIAYGTQIHPGESAWGVLAIHLTNCAMENSIYTFNFTVVVEQWNEFPTEPPQGFDNNEEWLDGLSE